MSINDPRVVTAFGKIIRSKTQLTNVSGAWQHYVHMAKWLIYVATILNLKGTSIEDVFLDATLRSMNSMERAQYRGRSVQAYNSWNGGWSRIIASNRSMIRDYIRANTEWSDALRVVNRG